MLKKLKGNKYFSGLLLFFLGAALGFFLPFLLNDQRVSLREIRLKQHYQYINPLLECELDNAELQQSLEDLKEKLTPYINQKTKEDNGVNRVAVYFRQLNSGLWFGITENEPFTPASLIKVPLMIAYFKVAETNPEILYQKITNNIEDGYTEQNFPPDPKLETNKEYLVKDLIEQMIVQSDNVAYDLLFDFIDKQVVDKVYEDLGVHINTDTQNLLGENRITIKDYSNFFKILYNASYLENKYSEAALEILAKPSFKRGLTAGIPPHIKIAHKFGERHYLETGERQFHDCGIIYYPLKPYLLCVMTRGTDFDLLIEAIKDISGQVYQKMIQ